MPHKNAARAPLRPLDLPTLALATGGLGFLRPAPGTWGSLPPVVIAALVAGSSQTAALIAVTALLVAASVACVALGSYAEHRFGRKDAPEVVADETAGVCLPALVAIGSTGAGFEQGAALALAFILFRVFDIAKPWPVARLESLPSGWGVLLDDLMAGLYAAALLLIGLLVWSG